MSMWCYALFTLATVASLAGCGGPQTPAARNEPAEGAGAKRPAAGAQPPPRDAETSALAAKYQPARAAALRPSATEPIRPAHGRKAEPLAIEGIWVPSGWMGDAVSGNALRYRVCEDDPHSPPTCDEWSYDPSQGRQGWAAAGYQNPDSNWGAQQGKDLSKRGFTQLTFFARGKSGGERILFKSGGHTTAGAAFPATYESTSGVITLTTRWTKYSIPLEGRNLSNTATALAFSVSRQLCPRGCVFYLDDATFCGPEEGAGAMP